MIGDPFARNRIIDLSKKAAEELGFIKNGVAKVRVEILEDESRKYVSTDLKMFMLQNQLKLLEVSKKIYFLMVILKKK